MGVTCFYCGAQIGRELPSSATIECPECTVELHTFVGLWETWEDVIRRFEVKYGFDPRELFPRLRGHKPTYYVRQDFEAHAIRHLTLTSQEDIAAVEDEKLFRFLEDVAQR